MCSIPVMFQMHDIDTLDKVVTLIMIIVHMMIHTKKIGNVHNIPFHKCLSRFNLIFRIRFVCDSLLSIYSLL